MSNPVMLAMVVQFAALAAVLLYVRVHLRMEATSVLTFGALCLPVALFQYRLQYVFMGDLFGILLAVWLLWSWSPRMRGANARNWIVGAYCCGVVVWTVISALLATSFLGETIQPSKLSVFILRSVCNIAFFAWAYRTGFSNPRALVLLTIPVLMWLVFAGAGLAQFVGLVNVDAFWARDAQYFRTDDLVSGFMGMDKPQLALWAVYTSAIAHWLKTGQRGISGWLSSIVLPISALVVLLIGSRQGLLALCAVIVVSAIIQIARWRPAPQLAPVLAGLAVLVLVTPILWNATDPVRRARATAKFEEAFQVSSVADLANKRDSSSLTLLQYISDSPHRLLIGSGVATDYAGEFETAVAFMRTYAEGEFLRLLWAGGLVSLLSYMAVLGVMCAAALKGLNRPNGPVHADAAGLLLVLTVTGGLFALGQFHLFTALYHNVPICYLLWAASGILMGYLARCAVGREYPAWEARFREDPARRTLYAHEESTTNGTVTAVELNSE